MKNLSEYRVDGYSFCTIQKPKLDSGIIGKLLCALICNREGLVIHVIRASLALFYAQTIVDENGDIITKLDSDLQKKLVVTGDDLNLWYALLQSDATDEEIEIELLEKGAGRNGLTTDRLL